MLVLSRKKDEWIEIGGNIRILVVEIRGDKVRLAIEAPREVPVHRKEIADAIRAEKAQWQREIDSANEPGIGEDYA